MTSSTWRFDSAPPLACCGVDAERVDRFTRLAAGPDNPLPLVFSFQEFSQHRGAPDAAVRLCAAFCCKEALVKALGEPYDLTECRLPGRGPSERVELELGTNLLAGRSIDRVVARVTQSPADSGEIVAAVYVFRKAE